MIAPTLAATAVFVLVHLYVGKLRFLDGVPRSRWLSMAGGVAVAYVFLHILPELAARQSTVEHRTAVGRSDLLEAEIHLVALAGLAVFYGLERHVRGARADASRRGGADRDRDRVFWLHIGSFALYNVLIGYLLTRREDTGPVSLAAYAVAMALHFVTNDHGLRQHHGAAYDHTARWLLAGSVVAGWLLGLAVEVSEVTIALFFAFLSGGVVLNVLKEELPEDRESRFLPFAAGAAVYGALLMAAL